MNGIIRCAFDKEIPIADLKRNPKNRNKHTSEQISRLAAILKYQGIRKPIIVSKRSGFIVTGHGTLDAISKNGWDLAPVSFQDFENDEQEYAHMIADNSIAQWADLDFKEINIDVPDLGPDFNIEMLGLKDFMIDPSDKNFAPGTVDDQGKLDTKKPIICPSCKYEFTT